MFYQVDDIFGVASYASDESVVLSGHRAPEHRALDQQLAGDAGLVVALVVAGLRKVSADRRPRTAIRLQKSSEQLFHLKKLFSQKLDSTILRIKEISEV